MEPSIAATDEWHSCPGCGVTFPGPLAHRARSNASEACWQLYGEVVGYGLTHLATLGRFHQLTVDAYGAQHAGGGASSLGVAFALIGLRLSLDDGWSANQVRDAHRSLAAMSLDWPEFAVPEKVATMTIFDVALADSEEAHADLVTRWAGAVWASWRARHDDIETLIAQRLRTVSPPKGSLHGSTAVIGREGGRARPGGP